MGERGGIWLYAVAGRNPAIGPGDVTGVGGAPVRTISDDGLTAFGSDVPLDEFGESALRVNLEDLAWLEATATAHHRVIEAVWRGQPVVPMRLATVYSADAHVRAMLGQRGADLREVLRRTGACREWGIKAYTEPRPDHAGGRQAGASRSGADYLRRRRDELATQKDSRREALESAEQIHEAMCRRATAARLHPPQAPQLSGTAAAMVLNGAYLITHASEGEFREAVQQAARQHPAIRLQVTGPWPPYSFAGLEPDTVDDPEAGP